MRNPSQQAQPKSQWERDQDLESLRKLSEKKRRALPHPIVTPMLRILDGEGRLVMSVSLSDLPADYCLFCLRRVEITEEMRVRIRETEAAGGVPYLDCGECEDVADERRARVSQ